MKKIILILVVFLISLSCYAKSSYSYNYSSGQGRYVNEKIDVPVIKLGIPQEIFEEQEEAGLEISWNKWRANISNELANRMNQISLEIVKDFMVNLLEQTAEVDVSNLPQNFMCLITAKVNFDRTVENIIVLLIPRDSFVMQSNRVYATKNSKIYMYNAETKKYYRWLYQGNPINFNVDNGNGDEKVIKKLLSNGEMQEINYGEVLFPNYIKQVANKVAGLNGKNILNFPAKSKRRYVNIFFGTTDIAEIYTIKKATENMFNDIERQR